MVTKLVLRMNWIFQVQPLQFVLDFGLLPVGVNESLSRPSDKFCSQSESLDQTDGTPKPDGSLGTTHIGNSYILNFLKSKSKMLERIINVCYTYLNY